MIPSFRFIFLTENIEKSPVNFTISNKQLIEGYKIAEEKKGRDRDWNISLTSQIQMHTHQIQTRKFMQSNPVAWIIYSGINKNFKSIHLLETDITEIPIIERII